MKRPFDFIGKEKIDLSKQDHRDIVIERNKILKKILDFGLEIDEKNIEVLVKVKLDCPVCGTQLENEKECSTEHNYEINVLCNMPNLDCPCCNHRYIFSTRHETYDIKKPVEKIVKLK